MDIKYNWNEYDNLPEKSSKSQSENPLSQIKVFAKLTNEEIMYKKAKDLGQEASRMRDALDRKRSETIWLDPTTRNIDKIVIETAFASIKTDSFTKSEEHLTEKLGVPTQ